MKVIADFWEQKQDFSARDIQQITDFIRRQLVENCEKELVVDIKIKDANT
jgi:hypothetical protein